nr:formin-like protein 5 [Lolium perenne]
MDWEWGFVPLSCTNPPTAEAKERFPRIAAEKRGPKQKRDLDEVDPDPYIHWTDLKMGRTHTPRPDAPSASTQPQVHEHVAPLQAEVGREYMEKLTSQGKKHKAPTTEAGSSQGPPAKCSRTEVVGGKAVDKKRYQGKQMPIASGTSSAPPSEAPSVEPTGATPTPPPNQGPAPTPSQGPSTAKPTPPPESSKLLKPEPFKGKAAASSTPSPGSQQLALHASRAAVAAGEVTTGLLGRITELKREGRELGHLLEYAEKWNQADVSAATRGLGKDRLPAVYPTAIPEASIEALKAQLSTLQDEKEQLIQEHRKALDAQKAVTRGLKDDLIQIGLRHDQELKDAKAAAEAQLKEALDDSVNSTAVLRAELEEGGLFPDSQAYAQKKVAERRIAQAFKNLDPPWDPYDHLVALSAWVSHMRAVDRNLADVPEVAIQLFKALRTACSWYEDLDLDAFVAARQDAPTDMDPALTAKRKDRAYRIAEYAAVRTFIPPPPGVTDYLSDYEEEEDEDEDVGEDAPPEGADAGNVPPEAPA